MLTIAGSDPSGGAGIQADIKTMTNLNCYAAAVITALTAQNTQGVISVYTPPIEFFSQQLHAVLSDLQIDAVKIGMINQVELVLAIKKALLKYDIKNIILDPVMVAKGGYQLVNDQVMQAMTEELFPLARLITPNIAEVEKITGVKIETEHDVKKALKILSQNKINVLIKGGHLPGNKCRDFYYEAVTKKTLEFSDTRIETNNTHGTGCTLSSAIAALSTRNIELSDAIAKAKQFLTVALIQSKNYRIGHGIGPVDTHLYPLSG